MPSPIKSPKGKRASLSDVFHGLEITPKSSSEQPPNFKPINLPKAIKEHMRSTMRLRNTVTAKSLKGVTSQFTIAMDDAYDYKVAHHDFDPEIVYPEVVELGNQLSDMLQAHLEPKEDQALEHQILSSLASIVYGSNMIERAGSELEITLQLCFAIFKGEEVPDDIGEISEEFKALKQANKRKNLPVSTSAVLRSRQEIVQHAKAASFLMTQLCLYDKDLSERILLETHGILTYKVDTEDTPWQEYSGVYRTDAVCAGFHGFPAPALVPSKMKAMILELERDIRLSVKEGTIDPISLAAKYTHIFVNIHPFVDGNGRMCRLILNAMLLKFGSYLVCIGCEKKDRETYLEVAANGGAFEDLYENAEEGEKPKVWKELSSFVLDHVKVELK
ncbi:unnamed protein product, partial [Penicillium discolor]